MTRMLTRLRRKAYARRNPLTTRFKEMSRKARRKAAARNESDASFSATMFHKMLERQNGRCALTGVELTADNLSCDHVKPLCRGGTHSIDNMQLVTLEANYAKGKMMPEEFLELCQRVVVTARKNKRRQQG